MVTEAMSVVWLWMPDEAYVAVDAMSVDYGCHERSVATDAMSEVWLWMP